MSCIIEFNLMNGDIMKLQLTLKELAYITKLVGMQNGTDKQEILLDSVGNANNTHEEAILAKTTYNDLNNNLYLRLNQAVREIGNDSSRKVYKVLYQLGDDFIVSKKYYSTPKEFEVDRPALARFIQLIKESETEKFITLC